MMRELHGIANNLNQIAQKAHTLNVVDVQRYDTCARQLETAIKKDYGGGCSPAADGAG